MKDTPLSNYLRFLRNNHGYSQDELAALLGVTRSTYSHYENARIMPSTESLVKLSAFYKVSLSKLINLAVMSSGEQEERVPQGAEYVITDEEIEGQKDRLYADFLKECADMTPAKLSKWASIEDRELIYYYHRLDGRSKRLINNVVKMAALEIQGN